MPMNDHDSARVFAARDKKRTWLAALTATVNELVEKGMNPTEAEAEAQRRHAALKPTDAEYFDAIRGEHEAERTDRPMFNALAAIRGDFLK